MLVLGIETTCDETAAAVVERGDDGRGRILSNIVLSQVDRACRLRRRGAGDRRARPCRGARPHHRQGDDRGRQELRRARRHRRGRRPGPDRRRHRRPDHRQGDRAGQRQAADRGQSSRSPCADRAADRRRRRFPIACSSPPAATPRSSRCAASATTRGSAPRSTTPSARPSTRPRSCSASAIRAARRSRRRPRAATPRASRCRGRCTAAPTPDFSLSGLKTALRLEAEKIAPLSRPGRRRSVRLVPAGRGRRGASTGCAPACACSARATARRPRWSPPAASPPTRRSARCCSASRSRTAPCWWCRRRSCAPTTAR